MVYDCAEHCAVTKVQLNLYCGPPTQKIGEFSYIGVDLKFSQSFSKTLLKSVQNPATKYILWKIYTEIRDGISQILDINNYERYSRFLQSQEK